MPCLPPSSRVPALAQIAGLFLACSLVLLVGCLLETYGGLRPVSDAARRILYHRGFYEADLPRLAVLRVDPPEILRVRTIQRHLLLHVFTFLWLVVSSSRSPNQSGMSCSRRASEYFCQNDGAARSAVNSGKRSR
jgi:hypothetical protein